MVFSYRAKKDTGLRTNEQIIANEVRVISSTGKQLGIISIREALIHAEDEGFDLVEVSPDAKPPVCKIIDIGKFKYDAQKKANVSRKKQKIVLLKEIKMRPVTETHDYKFKVKNAKKFIAKGDKVKFTIRFKGRELQHSHLGRELMDKIKTDMQDIGKGDKVKFTIRFKGRELQHSHLGRELMDKIKEDMKEVGKVELHPKFDGKQMIMVIQPL